VRPVVCSIGTSDPWNAVGLGLDIRSIAEAGGRPVTVVAGVSAQAADGVREARAVEASLIAAQLAALAGADIRAYRIGALLDRASADTVARHLALAGRPAVYDPVLSATAGGRFGPPNFAPRLIASVAQHVTLLTPNVAEACELAGVTKEPGAAGAEVQRELALRLRMRTGAAVLVTGGDLAGEPVDVLADEHGVATYSDTRIPTTMRGTGCLLAAVAAVELARGTPLREAVVAARAFVRAKLLATIEFGGANVAY
jgi:hydroxymethylpyrimidine/phosphomethylpyrimidine kinase